MKSEMLKRCCAIIVTYNVDESFTDRYKKLKQQLSSVIIVDNNSNADTKSMLTRLSDDPGTHIILCKENLGIAEALNIGIHQAEKVGMRWVITFDHDSEVTEGFVQALLEAYNTHSDGCRVGVVAPVYVDVNLEEKARFVIANGRIFFKRVKCEVDDLEVLTVITSGSLISIDALNDVGLFRADYFIDYVDNEHCLRLRSKGYKIIVTPKAILKHQLGMRSEINVLGYRVKPTNHSPFRKYYMTRNRILTYRTYCLREPNWMMFELIAFAYDVLRVALFEKERMRKLSYIITGFVHGLRGVTGAYGEKK